MNSGSPGSIDILALLQNLPAEARQQIAQQFIAGGVSSPAQGGTPPAPISNQPSTLNETSRAMPFAPAIASQPVPAAGGNQAGFAPPPTSAQGNARSPLSQIGLNGNTLGYGSTRELLFPSVA